jgi:translation elongation factor EF-G
VDGSRTQLVELIGHAPLSELKGYSTYLRTLTSGRADLGLEVSHYQLMGDEDERKAIEDVTGFKPN